jgi:hypothetical protein
MQHYPPEHQKKNFHCPLCGVYAKQEWADGYHVLRNTYNRNDMTVAECSHCKQLSYWLDGRMIYPPSGTVELPSPDLPENCLQDYEEARDIVARSPKGAAAILRLCIQKLMVHLGLPGNNINNDIASLVEAGLPPLVQRSLDICRVVGNNAVHPGEIDLSDSPEIANHLFRLVNLIVQDRITRPREVEELYGSLPEGAREAIERRDA